MPRECRTLHAHGKLADAGKDLQLPEMVWLRLFVERARYHAMKFVEQLLGFLPGLSLHRLRHHAGRGFRDGAPRALETDIPELIVLNVEIDVQLIAAERVIAFGSSICVFKLMKIPRLLVVIEDDLLIELRQFRHIDLVFGLGFLVLEISSRLQNKGKGRKPKTIDQSYENTSIT